MGRESLTYDFIFVGAGASTSLLLMALQRRNLLAGSKVLILDGDSKLKNDKTYCFWANTHDSILEHLEAVIGHRWLDIEVAGQSSKRLDDQVYARVSSLQLYEHIRNLGARENWEIQKAEVSTVGGDSEGPWVEIDGQRIRCKRVLDSRPPEWQKPRRNDVHLWQSFAGWHIQTLNPCFDPSRFSMMDFEVPQEGNTQFVYVLPTSENEALVELTRFGKARINSNHAENELAAYILNHYGQVHVRDKEFGCIPMSSMSLPESEHQKIWNLGARAGLIKPSTGYAFKSMYEWSERAANHWFRASCPAFNRKPRHGFYDKLLLGILEKEPEQGKPIFERLFATQSPESVFQFLDEKMSLKSELSMLVRLPWAPFMRAIGRYYSNTLQAMVVTLFTLCFLALGWVPDWQGLGALVLGILGLALIGLPHGAVDHILETGTLRPSKLPAFILEYIAKALVLAGIWYLFPVIGLGLFLLYSAWHFGQADGETWSWSGPRSMVWGASVLFFLLGTHSQESTAIIQLLSGESWTLSLHPLLLLLWLPLAVKERNLSWAWTLIWLSLSSWLPLLIAFGLYFIGHHSWNGWKHITQRMKRSSIWVWKQSLPFHLGAWVLLGLFLWIWPSGHSEEAFQWAAPFFIFLSCLSFPHVWAMHRFYIRTKTV
jgi:lycopene beta-cyclase